MTANEKFIESCNKADIELLRAAIAEGADVNLETRPGGSTYFEEMVFDWGSDMRMVIEKNAQEFLPALTEDQLVDFATVLVENGLNLDHCSGAEDGDPLDTFWYVAKWGRSLKLLDYLLQNGLKPAMQKTAFGLSPLEQLQSDLDLEIMCDHKLFAQYLTEVIRLSIAYGALIPDTV